MPTKSLSAKSKTQKHLVVAARNKSYILYARIALSHFFQNDKYCFFKGRIVGFFGAKVFLYIIN